MIPQQSDENIKDCMFYGRSERAYQNRGSTMSPKYHPLRVPSLILTIHLVTIYYNASVEH